MGTNDGGHRARAVAALGGRDYRAAGDEYTRAAWRVLADPREDLGPFEADERGWVGEALGYFTAGAVAYRVAGADPSASRRAVEGIAVARDLERGLERPAQQACLQEFVADLRVAGDAGDAEAAYADARAAYEGLDGLDAPRGIATSPLFEAAATTVKQVARGGADGEIAVEWADLHGSDPSDPGAFLAERAQFKRQRFPSLVDRAVEAGHLAAPRGTTEYGNDSYRCPNCDARDVNWVADSVLCLRCSTPMDRD